MISRIDELGNVFLIENSRFGINLYIRLKEDKHRMHKGTIDELNQMMFIEVEEKENKVAYPLNHFILTNGKKFKEIAIIEYSKDCDNYNQYNIYLISLADILSNAKHYGVKGGFEKQIYIEKEFMEKFKLHPEEKITLMKQYKKVK